MEVMADYPVILKQAITDSYLYLEFKIVLTVIGGAED